VKSTLHYGDFDRYALARARGSFDPVLDHYRASHPWLFGPGSLADQTVMGSTAPNPVATQNPIRHAAQFLGRDQGTELFFSGAWAAAAGITNVQVIPKAFNINRPLKKIILRVTFVDTLTTAGYTTINAETPQNILQNIRISGTHAKFGALVPINISGATQYMRGMLRKNTSSAVYLTPTAGGVPAVAQRSRYTDNAATVGVYGTLAAPGALINTAGGGSLFPLISPGALLLSAIGNTPVTIDIFYEIDTAPMFGPWSRLGKLPFSWRPEDWGDSLQIQLTFGEMNAFGTIAASADSTFTVPTYNIYTVYDLLGAAYVSKISPAVQILNEQTIPVPAASGNNQRLALLQKQKTLSVLVKSGVLASYANIGPNTCFQIMDDTILEATQIVADNKPVHNNLSNRVYKEHLQEIYDVTWPQGYFAIDFGGSQNPLTYYRGDNLAGSATFELDTNVTANPPAHYGITMVQEQIIGEPALG
jgi:hypothetical protein